MFETFLHLAVIARSVTGIDSDWGEPKWRFVNQNDYYMSYIQCSGITKDKNIAYNLKMGKFIPNEELKRNGLLKFQNGIIKIDFNIQELTCRLNHEPDILFTISTRKEFLATKYSIQLDMVERCFEEHIVPSIIDGSDIQIRTLEWLFSQKKKWVITNK